MKRLLTMTALLISMAAFSACSHKSHDHKSCGGDAKCEDCTKGHCKMDHADKDKCDGKCGS